MGIVLLHLAIQDLADFDVGRLRIVQYSTVPLLSSMQQCCFSRKRLAYDLSVDSAGAAMLAEPLRSATMGHVAPGFRKSKIARQTARSLWVPRCAISSLIIMRLTLTLRVRSS
jgi:hypothetical protein